MHYLTLDTPDIDYNIWIYSVQLLYIYEYILVIG
jgi:hypothetical protein